MPHNTCTQSHTHTMCYFVSASFFSVSMCEVHCVFLFFLSQPSLMKNSNNKKQSKKSSISLSYMLKVSYSVLVFTLFLVIGKY